MVIQKLRPSLQAPFGKLFAPVLTKPSGVRSAAFHSETLFARGLVINIRSPSNAAVVGLSNPLPDSVASTTPVDARTTDTVFEPVLGTQMLAPSNTGKDGPLPTATVWLTRPVGSSLINDPGSVP